MSRPLGYPPNIFPQEVENKYKCTLCSLILRNPIQSYCGHRFCSDCIQHGIRNEGMDTCPACESEGTESEFSSITLDQTFPDNAIKRELFSMKTVCPFQECSWSGSFKEFETHYITCEHREVECSSCGTQYPLSRQADHLQNECPLREVTCPHCQQKLHFKDVSLHNEECSRYPVECPTCNEHLPREQLAEHRRSHGEGSGGLCLYQCGKPVSEGSVERHVEQNIAEHVDVLSRRIGSIEATLGLIPFPLRPPAVPGRSVNERLTALEATVRALQEQRNVGNLSGVSGKPSGTAERSTAERPRAGGGGERTVLGAVGGATEGAGVQRKMPGIEEKMAIYEGVITVLNREVEKLTLQMDSVEGHRRQDREHLEAMDRKVKSLERSLALKDVTISELDLKILALEQTCYDGTLLWRVSDFSRRRQEALTGRTASIYSPAFYTSKTGYKMCARLYLNGDGMGKGTHVSVFFVIMRGQYDALLKWPFRQKVTLMFLDQSGKEHVVDAFRPDPSSSSFKRPTTEMNIASGCPLFMSFNALENPSFAYVKDNTAFLKIIVDCTDLN